MSGPQPLTPQGRPWHPRGIMHLPEGVLAHVYERGTGYGTLTAIVAQEPQGWHLSVSWRNSRGRPTRYPTWDEIADARYRLLPDDRDFVMHLPPPGEYVACHPTTFHLHEHPSRTQ